MSTEFTHKFYEPEPKNVVGLEPKNDYIFIDFASETAKKQKDLEQLEPIKKSRLLAFMKRKKFCIKAKIFEAVLNNIITNYEEDLENKEKLGKHKLKRVFGALYEETVGNKITDPVLKE